MSTNPAQLEILLNQTLNQTRQWLAPYPMPSVRLRRSSDLLIRQLQQALGRGSRREIRWFIDRLTDLSDNIRKSKSLEYREPSVIMIECALAAYQMQNYAEAVKFLECAMEVCEGGYTEHFEAVIRSMLGCIDWRSSGQQDKAIVCWEQSIGIYQGLQQNNDGMQLSGWYADRIDEINSILELALELAGTPAPSASATDTPPAAAATPDVSSTLTGDMLRLFSVVEEVQAGSLGVVGAPDFLGYVEMSQCQINGVVHYIVNLKGTGKTIKFSWDKNYGVIKIKGDSMNALGIDDGDYVLLHFQNDATPSDIVAAQIRDIDTEATLKKYLKRGNEAVLQFCSHNPEYKGKEYVFTQLDDFQIVGVAIAVFKPM
jgi:hypothetical protein